MTKRKIISMLLAGTFGMSTMLSGCGGGGGSSVPTDTGSTSQTPTETLSAVSGVVADGYLRNAKVCLDVNSNKACDEDEPSVFSGAGGKYTIAVEELAKLPDGTSADDFPILVEVKPEYEVYDEVDGGETPVTKEYILSAPKGKPEFVSPITTLIQEEMESSVEELTPEQAEKTVKARIGVADDVDLFDDYIAPDTDHLEDEADKEALKEKMRTVHMVAQVVANTMGDMKEQLDQVDELKDVSLDVIIKAVVNEVMNRLETIVTQVEAAKAAMAEDPATEFNAQDLAGNVVAADGGFDSTKAQEAVAVAEMERKTGKASFKDVLENGGSSWLELHFDYDEQLDKPVPELEVGTVKLDRENNLSEEEAVYDFTSGTWGEAVAESENSFVLTANGWTEVIDGPEGYDMAFDGLSVVLTRRADGLKEILNVAEADLAGKSQGHFAGRMGMFLSDPAKPFDPEAKGHRLSFSQTADSYEIRDEEWNTVYLWGENHSKTPIETLDEMLSTFAYVDAQGGGEYLGVAQDLNLQFEELKDENGAATGAGVLHLFFNEPCSWPPRALPEKGAWKRFAPVAGGPEIILVDIPGAYAFKYGEREEHPFFAEMNGEVKRGEFMAAGVQSGMDELMYNPVAIESLKTNLDYAKIEMAPEMGMFQDSTCPEPEPGHPNDGTDPNGGGEPNDGTDPNGGEPPVLDPPAAENIGAFTPTDLAGQTLVMRTDMDRCIMTFDYDPAQQVNTFAEVCEEKGQMGDPLVVMDEGTWEIDSADGSLLVTFAGDLPGTFDRVLKLNDGTQDGLSLYIEEYENDQLVHATYEFIGLTAAFADPTGSILTGRDGVQLSFSATSGQFDDPMRNVVENFTWQIVDGALVITLESGALVKLYQVAEGATEGGFSVMGTMVGPEGTELVEDDFVVSPAL